jgi:hypothetical protein
MEPVFHLIPIGYNEGLRPEVENAKVGGIGKKGILKFVVSRLTVQNYLHLLT